MKKIVSSCLKVAFLLLILFAVLPGTVQAQDVASLKEAVVAHYKLINTGEDVSDQHQSDFTIFFNDGSMLVTPEDIEVANQVAFAPGEGGSNMAISANVVPYNFTARIYDNVGLATFYLWGSYGSGEDKKEGMWRVSAVWIYEDGVWREAHHHESPLEVSG